MLEPGVGEQASDAGSGGLLPLVYEGLQVSSEADPLYGGLQWERAAQVGSVNAAALAPVRNCGRCRVLVDGSHSRPKRLVEVTGQ